VAGVELQVRGGTGRAADRPPVHPADEAEERLGGRGVAEDVGPLVGHGRAAALGQAGLARPAVQAKLTAPRRSGRLHPARRALGAARAVALVEPTPGRMFGEFHGDALFSVYASIIRKKPAYPSAPDCRNFLAALSSRAIPSSPSRSAAWRWACSQAGTAFSI